MSSFEQQGDLSIHIFPFSFIS